MPNLLLSVFLFFSLLPGLVTAATLLPPEKQMQEYLNSQHNNQLQLLEKLVEVNSGTSNLAGVRQVGDILKPLFEQLGFKTVWVEEPVSLHRAPTLITEHPGHKGPKIILIGHLDTVFPADSRFQHIGHGENKLIGPGVIDDKGGLLVILYALKAMQAVHALDDANITVVLTGDEEDSGKPTRLSRKPLMEAARQADVALDFEWSLARDSATIARRGVANWLIQVQGKEAHSSEIFQDKAGAGANYELARILNDLRVQLAAEQLLSVSPGLILGGTQLTYDQELSSGQVFGKGNVIARMALARGDLRFLSTEQKDRAEKRMTEIVGHHLDGTKSSITFQESIPAMPPTTENRNLLAIYSQASEDLGYGKVKAVDPGKRGAGDISYLAGIVPAKLAGLGPVGTGAHSEKESMDLSSLPMQTQRAALLIYRLSRR